MNAVVQFEGQARAFVTERAVVMRAAGRPRVDAIEDRLVVIDRARNSVDERAFSALPSLLAPGDLLVVNDAATLPSSLQLTTRAGEPVEARILDGSDDGSFGAVVFGRGSWRDDTDHRPPPPALAVGDTLASAYAGAGDARVVDVSSLSPRLVRLALDATLRARLFEVGAPVQYSYMDRALTLAEVQTPYASRPWAAEMPSAGRALTTSILVALRRRGVDVARITAAAGLSATGDAALDRLLPFPEQYEISREAAAQIDAARARGGRVIAVGTSTVRALESAARDDGSVQAGRAIASLIISPRTQTRVVDALLSGMHEAGTSHDSLLRAFAPAALVDAAIELGRRRGLLVHELGDHCVIL